MLPNLHRAPSMLSTHSSAFSYGMLSNNNMGQSFHTGAFADHSEEEIVWGHSDTRYDLSYIFYHTILQLTT